MPSVKGLQEKYGKDKLAVLLLSVDKEYTFGEKEPVNEDNEVLKKQGVDWPNVMLPKGFNDTQRLFNVDGYGSMLIDPGGIVRGVDIRAEEVEQLIASQK